MKETIELDKKFPLDAYSVELKKRKEGKDFFHWHECYEITCIRSGSGIYYVRDTAYEVHEGDIVIFNKVEPHSWEISGNENLWATVLVFNSRLIADSFSLFDYDYLEPFTNCSINFKNRLPGDEAPATKIAGLIEEILEENQARHKGYQLMIKSLLLQILTVLIRYYADTINIPEPLEERKKKLNRIEDAIAYINEHFTGEISLKEVADIAAMSSNYFSGYFRDATGFSFSEYLSRLRIYRAADLIKHSDRTLLDIAGDCGFNNISNFYRTYKKVLAESPRKKR